MPMSEILLQDRQREALRQLRELAQERAREQLTQFERKSQEVIQSWGQLREILSLRLPPQKPVPQKSPALKLKQQLLTARHCLKRMAGLRLPRCFRGRWLPAVFILIWLG